MIQMKTEISDNDSLIIMNPVAISMLAVKRKKAHLLIEL